jgi:hypothetical protein
MLAKQIATADCKRGFSRMLRAKTCLRNQMNNSTLNHYMRISMEGSEMEHSDFNMTVNT